VIIVSQQWVVRVDRHRLQRVVLLGPIAGHVLSVCPSRKESLWADGKSSNNCWVLGGGGVESIERVVMVVLVVLVVVGGEVRLGNLVNQGLSSARQAAILASECSQPARGSAASDESVQVRQIKVTLLSLATLAP
jgi:hypothetical protein